MNPTDLAAIDLLVIAITSTLAGENADVLSRSVAFGKSITDAIFAWPLANGYIQNNALPYTPPVGFGLWVSTWPAPAAGPYLGE